MNKILILILLNSILVLYGCASNIKGTPINGTYGCFCGKGRPDTSELNEQEAQDKLENILAIDDIDKICKIHDICYAEGKTDKKICDDLLLYLMHDLTFALTPDCKQLSENIKIYFRTLHPNRGGFANNALKIINPYTMIFIPLCFAWDAVTYPIYLASDLKINERCIGSDERKEIDKIKNSNFIENFQEGDIKKRMIYLQNYYKSLSYSVELHMDLISKIMNEPYSTELKCVNKNKLLDNGKE